MLEDPFESKALRRHTPTVIERAIVEAASIAGPDVTELSRLLLGLLYHPVRSVVRIGAASAPPR